MAKMEISATQPGSRQVQKSEEMRKRICDATLKCLADVGYERVSTKLISETGGMSRGAVNYHYPTRNDLLVAAYAHLLNSWEDRWPFTEVDQVGALDPGVLVDALWQGLFAQETYHAILELMLAARKDEELSTRLRKTLGPWAESRDIRTAALLGADLGSDAVLNLLQLNLCILRGITVNRFFDGTALTERSLVALWKEMFVAKLANLNTRTD